MKIAAKESLTRNLLRALTIPRCHPLLRKPSSMSHCLWPYQVQRDPGGYKHGCLPAVWETKTIAMSTTVVEDAPSDPRKVSY